MRGRYFLYSLRLAGRLSMKVVLILCCRNRGRSFSLSTTWVKMSACG